MSEYEAETACDVQQADYGLRPQYPPSTPCGALLGGDLSNAELEQRNREMRCQQAVYVLTQARQIKADAALMTEVRAYIRRLRDEGAALLDDLG